MKKMFRIIRTAFKSLGKNKLRSFFMMIGIVIGIAATTSVISVGLGAQKRVMERVKKFGLNSLMVFAGSGRQIGHPTGGQPETTLKLEDVEAMKNMIKQIQEAAPYNRIGSGMVKFKEKSITTRIFGITPSWEPVWDWGAEEGEFITEEDHARLNRVCLLGPTVKEALFENSNPIGERILIGNVPFQVKGIMQSKGVSPGGGDMDDRIYIPLNTFLRRVANVDYISNIKILLKDYKDIDIAAASIKSLLRERHKLSPSEPDDFSITTPTEVTQVAEKVSGTFSIFLVLISAISLIAGGFVIVNIMLISVNERRNEIGLRKAIGASSKDIQLQFLLESIVITILGGILGILLGFMSAYIFGIISQFPVSISWEGAVLGVVISGLVGLISGVQPAKRAAGLQPVEALSS